MFETELEYFISHQDELVRKHAGQVLVLRGGEVVEVCASPLAAYLAAAKKYERGTFMIQPATPGPSAYTVTIASTEVLVAP